MSDPLNPWEEKDRMEHSGDLSPLPEDEGRAPADRADGGGGDGSGDGNAATALNADTTTGDDANDLDADNAVEQDQIETLDPDNPPV
jgi:hypothetical protein